ncbi:hypothetical protein [Nocardia sp. NPDC050710]|uniref:hypothetical protein n=1 Tax=Nocardia sp. NPDC050710 TaxID=3157220 RepID=UPI0033FD38D4
MILTALARLALRAPRRIALTALFFALAAGAFAAPSTTGLPAGGFDLPGSGSIRLEQILDQRFDAGGLPIVFTVTAQDGVDSPAARKRGEAIVAAPNAISLTAALGGRLFRGWKVSPSPTIDLLNGMLQEGLDPAVPAPDKVELLQGAAGDPELLNRMAVALQHAERVWACGLAASLQQTSPICS